MLPLDSPTQSAGPKPIRWHAIPRLQPLKGMSHAYRARCLVACHQRFTVACPARTVDRHPGQVRRPRGNQWGRGFLVSGRRRLRPRYAHRHDGDGDLPTARYPGSLLPPWIIGLSRPRVRAAVFPKQRRASRLRPAGIGTAARPAAAAARRELSPGLVKSIVAGSGDRISAFRSATDYLERRARRLARSTSGRSAKWAAAEHAAAKCSAAKRSAARFAAMIDLAIPVSAS